MKDVKVLGDLIKFNSSFKTAVNLYLNLNKPEKVESYIPTKSSVNFIKQYTEAILENKEQATLLIGPYGKGKSHLLLVLLAVLSMKRNETNNETILKLIEKVKNVDESGKIVANELKKIWSGKPFLPVLISYSNEDLNQAFLYGLNDALKRDDLKELTPKTYYSIAIDRVNDWKKNFKNTYDTFEDELRQYDINIKTLISNLKQFNRDALNIFTAIYPKVTAGSEFNPMAVSDVLPLYKSVSERLVEDYGYSGIYIVFDEFSKFIESQDGHIVGNNMKLLQDICELATESQNAKIFFTMVAHKSIKEYGKYLSQDIINSFTGIEGRIIEKYFVTSSKNNYELIKNAIIKNNEFLEKMPFYKKMLGEDALNLYYQVPAFRSKFSKEDFADIILKGCYPLNPMASYLLLNVSEKVAQNERTLFTFISNDEPHSMARFVKEHTYDQSWSIGADLIYDYFSGLFKKEVSNEYVHNIWLGAEYVLGKCESEEQKKLVKALAIVQIVNKEDEIPADDKYLPMCVDIADPIEIIETLKRKQLIYKKSSTGIYAFKTKAGSELKSEIKKQRELKGDNINYSASLLAISGKYFYIPRRYNTQHFITRYFSNEYMNVEDFLNIMNSDAILDGVSGDGKVLTLYGLDSIRMEDVKKHIIELADTRLIVTCPKKSLKVFKQIRDYEIITELKNNSNFTNNNEILKNELPLMLEDINAELENYLYEIYEEGSNAKVFYYDGTSVVTLAAGQEENAVNKCCDILYEMSPIINNEMVNRILIGSAQTRKARNNIVQAILEHNDNEDFYSGSNQEATIYRSLFKVTGIIDGNYSKELHNIFDVINNYIDSCCDCKRSLSELINTLTSSPIGLRNGVIPIYLAYVLANRKEDIITYFSNSETQMNYEIVVNMCEAPSDYSLFVSKEDVQKEKYISELNSLFNVEDSRNLSTNRIKNIIICMQRWFRALPQMSRNLINKESYIKDATKIDAMMAVKKQLQKTEYNPYEILFVILPESFNSKNLEETFKYIDECKTYYDDYFDWMTNEVVKSIHNVWNSRNKKDLYHVLKEWYENQSRSSKQGLYSGRITNFMSSIENLDVYNDIEVAIRIAKAVSDVYIENWNTESFNNFEQELSAVKLEVENMKDSNTIGEYSLSFNGKTGAEITKIYSYADEGTGSVLRNIIEDALDEYSDLSVNDRVSILLEMIEKIIK